MRYHRESMRVIAGKYRSRSLTAPRGMDTRPTSDRLRETMFNVLAPRIEGASFLDIYAGSGGVGIEALSRGASHACFIENAAPAISAIRANLKSLGIGAGFRIETHSAAASLKRLQKEKQQFDIVFLDPPYDAEEQYEQALNLLGGAAADLLHAEVVLIAEHRKKQKLQENYGGLRQYRVLEQGDAALSFYSFAGKKTES